MSWHRRRRDEITIATWNLKQAVAPKQKPAVLWEWMERELQPHVVVLTEAKLPADGVPDGWTAMYREGGSGPRRRWGTVLAARNVDIIPVTDFATPTGLRDTDELWPGTVQVADIGWNGSYWATTSASTHRSTTSRAER